MKCSFRIIFGSSFADTLGRPEKVRRKRDRRDEERYVVGGVGGREVFDQEKRISIKLGYITVLVEMYWRVQVPSGGGPCHKVRVLNFQGLFVRLSGQVVKSGSKILFWT